MCITRGGYRFIWLVFWEAGCSQPLWVMTSLEDPRKGLEIYRRLMTIEESFKDLKSLLPPF